MQPGGKNRNYVKPEIASLAPAEMPKKRLPPRTVQLKRDSAKSRVLTAMIDPKVFTIRAACELADVGFKTFYDWKKADEDFAAAVAEAEELQTQNLEQRAGERAMGINVKHPSDLLMMFLLNGRRPSMYRQNSKVEHTGKVTLHDLVLDDAPVKAKK